MLTIEEVARRLNTPVETLDRWARQGKIPMNFIHGRYSMRAEVLEQWAKDHNLEYTCEGPGPCAEERPERPFDSIQAAMKRGGLFYDVPATDRDTALRSAVELIPGLEPSDRPRVLESLLEREQLASTGIGNGIALPHPRSNPGIRLEMPQITTCFLSGGVEFGAIDSQPVSVLMILLSNSTKQHLAMLSRLSYYLREADFRRCLHERGTEASIFKQIEAMEARG
jgi:PTS system nitrogen regulatory IIA component